MSDLERIRFVTRHFNDLQGLRYGVPVGLILLALEGPMLLRAGLFLCAFLLMLGAKRYYRATFGQVEQQPADPAAVLCPASVYSPAGCISRIEGFRQVTPFAHCLLATGALTVLLFAGFQAIQPSLRVIGDESLGQHPRVVHDPVAYFGKPALTFYPHGREVRPPSMARAVFGQMMLVFSGSFFLGIWLWRERRWSQSHHLILAGLLLGLSAFGASLGFVARGDGQIAPLIDLVLPVLVYPGQALLLCGSSMVLAGLFDHLQLVRALGRPVAVGEKD
jgi:hypothetical protein